MPTYDVLVLGCGAVGGAALYECACRGLRALGIDRFAPPHDRGSSHGRTRMIRQAYFEHPDYVPLVLRAYELWAELERAAQRTLYRETGLLQVGPPQGEVVPGVTQAAAQHGLAVDELSPGEIERRFPGFRVPPGMVGAFERRAGYLHVEGCIAAQLEQAAALGAALHENETVRTWRAEGATIVVETDRGRYEAGALAIAAGAWSAATVRDWGVPLAVRRKPQYWFAPRTDDYRADRGAPAFLYETGDGVFYGFPVAGPEGLKCAEHSGGATVDDPALLSREVDRADLARVERFLAAHLPGVSPVLVDHAPCMYTMSPDAHFVVDRHPRYGHVAAAAGLSGHGFKFAPVLGQALVELALDGRSTLPIEFLSAARFART